MWPVPPPHANQLHRRLLRMRRPLSDLFPTYVGIAIDAASANLRNLLGHVVVGSSGTKQRFKIKSGFRKKTGHQLSVGRQTNTCACRAEGLGHGPGNSDLAGTVKK